MRFRHFPFLRLLCPFARTPPLLLLSLLSFLPALAHSLNTGSPAFDPSTIRCGANGTILPTPSYGLEGAVFTVCSELLIRGSVEKVYDTVLDFNNYGKWNSFIPLVSIQPPISTPSQVHLNLTMTFTSTGLLPGGLNSTSTEIISVLDHTSPAALAVAAWGSNDPLVDLVSEHPTILTEVSGGSGGMTRSVSYETYYGAGAVGLEVGLGGNLQREFERENEDLRAWVEGGEDPD
ncbi:MAG: hypothetical protein Q9227_005430 [Pyrenula ochraceoflavens]